MHSDILSPLVEQSSELTETENSAVRGAQWFCSQTLRKAPQVEVTSEEFLPESVGRRIEAKKSPELCKDH